MYLRLPSKFENMRHPGAKWLLSTKGCWFSWLSHPSSGENSCPCSVGYNPSGKGSSRGLTIEAFKGNHDNRQPLLMRFFFFPEKGPNIPFGKRIRKAHYRHRLRLPANESRFLPLFWWEAGGRGHLR